MMKKFTNSKQAQSFGRPRWLRSIALLCLMILLGATNATAQTYGGGNGSEGNPYIISTASHLNELHNRVVAGDFETQGGYKFFKMTANINMGQNKLEIGAKNDGGCMTMSSVVFDGNGYSITNFDNTQLNLSNNRSCRGIFCSTQDVTIKNLNVSNFTVEGYSMVGGIVGNMIGGSIINCHLSNGSVVLRNTTQSTNSSMVGGLVGRIVSGGEIDGCSVANNVYICAFATGSNSISNTTRNLMAGGLVGRVQAYDNLTYLILDCIVSTDVKTYVDANYHSYCGGVAGEFLGGDASNLHIARVVLPWYNIHQTSNSKYRGNIIGYCQYGTKVALINTYSSDISLAFGISPTIIGAGLARLPNYGVDDYWYYWISTNLEMKSNLGNTMEEGNKKWGYGTKANLISNGPILTTENYIVTLSKGTNMSSITGTGYTSSTNYFFTPANTDVTLKSISTVVSLPHHRVIFLLDDTDIVCTIPQGQSNVSTCITQFTESGTISALKELYPYATTSSAAFNQWTNKVNFSWRSLNSNDVPGRWYVYQRKKDSADAWERYEGPKIKTGTNVYENYNLTIDISSEKWDFEWECAILFLDESELIPDEPATNMSVRTSYSSYIKIPITSFKADGLDKSIKVTANVPTQLTNSSAYSYTISRSMDSISFTPIVPGQSFDGSGKIEYTDLEAINSCDSYIYRLEISAFNRTFTAYSNFASSTGTTNLTSFTATKGEYNNQVRLEWSTDKTAAEGNDRYTVFRKVATNPEDVWTEMATINTNEISYIYTDDKAMPGIYYRYKVTNYQVCDGVSTPLASKEDMGFAQSLGRISGRITYGSGIAVKDVSVSVIRNDLQTNESQYHSLGCNGDGKTFYWAPDTASTYYNNIINNNFTYQFWVNPFADMTVETKIAELGNFANIFLVPQANGRYAICIKDVSETTVLTTTEGILPIRFTHIALVRDGNSLTCHIINDEDLSDIQLNTTTASHTFSQVTTKENMGIRMGYHLSGYIDECRLWSRALSAEEIRRDFNRILVGDEEKLKAYWTFDEGLDGDGVEEGYIFDVSCVGTIFNRNHGRHNLVSSEVVPTIDQLGLKAFTDAVGNYQIRGIPFSGTGSCYDVVPSLGVHKFNPTSHLRTISNSSLVYSGVDFTDVSTFNVSGFVYYEGGNYPVTDCNFEIDGVVQTKPNGTAVTNEANGQFIITVPIGEHTVRVVKTGHGFVNDGYLTMPEGGYNKHESGRMFYDTTLVKLVGHVVGGLTEHNKVLGFGETVNNTGAAQITLNAARDSYKFKTPENTYEKTYYHNEGQWKKPGGLDNDQTTVHYNEKDIKIDISPETGEFVAWVYPEPYNIGVITAEGYLEDIYNRGESIDLTKAAVPDEDMMKTSVRTWQDSVLVVRPGQIDHYEYFENSDTVRYHEEWTTYYQAVPTFKVTQLASKNPVPYFGEIEYTLEDEDTGESDDITLWDETNGYLFGAPVFKQGTKYTFAFEAYEQYVNNVSGVTYPYPIDQGTVNMSNTIALNSPSPISLDESGKGTYTFLAGDPDLTTGKRSFMGTVKIGSIDYYWDHGSQPIEVWHLGDRTTGTDFMTAGPNEITTILRDPPGSLSSSFIEAGTTITTNTKNEVKNGAKEAMKLTTSLGPQIKTFIGLGAGVMIESEVKFDASGGINAEQTWSSTEETSIAVTFTERIETSDDPLYVGHLGDVFIGNSTNIQYGLTNGIAIHKNYISPNPDENDELIKAGDYSIAPSVSLAYGQTFDTRFLYTQIELEEIMIPKWQDNLAIMLRPMGTTINTAVISNPVYVSNLPHNDVNFGKLNIDEEAFGDEAASPEFFHNGPSYTIYFPDNYDMTKFETDSVMWFNNQINGWINVLAQNEKEKVEMQKLGNYSIGSGASLTWSKTETSSKTTTSSFHWVLNPTVGLTTGADIMGIGIELETSMEYVHEEEGGSSEQTETSITSGFVLKEQGDDDQITIDYGMTKSGTIAFKSRGGRTSCPYEDAYITKYYQPGQHILSEATMQIEVPKIDVSGSNQVLNVPSNKPATFVLDLKNESETDEDVWFQLIVNEETNPTGATLKIDGGVIGNGRMFLVKAGEVLKKTLTVEKGTADSCDIQLILRSECQSDPTDFLPVIADTTNVIVKYVPGCSEVNISEPYNNWIVNTETGDTLRIVLDGFQRDYENFGYIQLEYRNVSSPTWSTLMNFYANENIFNNATGNKTLILDADPNIIYDWGMNIVTDASYELRATAVCVNVDANGAILGILSQSSSQIITGRKDMTRPEALGAPSPVNGILSIGDEISITFNEEIQTGMLTTNNFSISGVLNGSEIAEPNTGLYFTGTGSAFTELPIAVNGSFSIETWFKRINGTAGTLFSYGEGNNFISLSLDATGHAVVQIGDEIQTSVSAMSNTTNTWKYIGLAYNRSENTIYVYGFQDSDPTIELFVSKPFTNVPPTLGKLYVGNTNDNSNGFKGTIAMTHFYNVAHTSTEMTLVKNISKSGTEPNLIGLWEMSEAEGSIAKDKARSRNLIVDTDWYIYPAGRSLLLNGNQYATIPNEDFGFRYFDDFTIELQFKSATQGEATVLSVGETAYLEFDADNKFVLTAGGNTQVLTNKNLLDGNWHHVALSVKRGGMTTAIIDGVATSTFSSSIFGDLVGGVYYLGAHFYSNTSTGFFEYTKHFNGNIDELRVWNTALSTSIINQNRKYKLVGNEVGLKSYFPFEAWEKLPDGTTLVSDSNIDFVDDTNILGGTFSFDNIAAAIIDYPGVTKIANEKISYVASSNKIVLTIDEEFYKIEGVTLEISVKDVLDLRGNVSKPA
ncbi:LamG domain-containing protein, partial [Bacteroidales bacterium OttesenSCG-928-L14]|nr:LamG domain-containing protein [Bacteroidales bacterium OttesenSCG-928-L14]